MFKMKQEQSHQSFHQFQQPVEDRQILKGELRHFGIKNHELKSLGSYFIATILYEWN